MRNKHSPLATDSKHTLSLLY